MKAWFTVSVLLFGCAGSGWADSLTLNSGEVILGTIVSQSDTEIVMEISNATGTIMTQRKIPTADVRSVERDTAEQKARRLEAEAHRDTLKYQLGDSSFPFPYYGQTINGVFRKYLVMYPDSPNADAVRARIQEWEAEQVKVAKGEMKYRGQWYAGADARRIADVVAAEQLFQDGARLLSQGKHEDAAWRYRSVLLKANHLDTNHIEQAAQSLTEVYRSWNLSLWDRQAQIENEAHALRQQRQELDKRRHHTVASLDAIKARSQHNTPSSGSGAPKVGPLLGDVASATHLRSQLQQIDADLADNQRKQTQLATDSASIANRLTENRRAVILLPTDKQRALNATRP